jgi:hypothetical protein
MTYAEEATRLIETLPPEQAQAVVDYAKSLAAKHREECDRIAAELDVDKLLALIEKSKPEREELEKDPEY